MLSKCSTLLLLADQISLLESGHFGAHVPFHMLTDLADDLGIQLHPREAAELHIHTVGHFIYVIHESMVKLLKVVLTVLRAAMGSTRVGSISSRTQY